MEVADKKVKNLIYLYLRQEESNFLLQRNPQVEISKITTNAVVEQLKNTVKVIRKQTFDRLFFNSQNVDELMKKFHLRIMQEPALCNWEELDYSLIKSVFIQAMRNSQKQINLLSEDREPTEA